MRGEDKISKSFSNEVVVFDIKIQHIHQHFMVFQFIFISRTTQNA